MENFRVRNFRRLLAFAAPKDVLLPNFAKKTFANSQPQNHAIRESFLPRKFPTIRYEVLLFRCLMVYVWSSLVPRPRPAFRRLQYSLVPRPHPAFRRLQYFKWRKAGWGLYCKRRKAGWGPGNEAMYEVLLSLAVLLSHVQVVSQYWPVYRLPTTDSPLQRTSRNWCTVQN